MSGNFASSGFRKAWLRSRKSAVYRADSVQSDEVLDSDNWTSVVVGRYEELPDRNEYAEERGKAQALLEKRSMWWQTSYVAATIRDRPEAPVFYCIHTDEISGLRASPEGGPVRVR